MNRIKHNTCQKAKNSKKNTENISDSCCFEAAASSFYHGASYFKEFSFGDFVLDLVGFENRGTVADEFWVEIVIGKGGRRSSIAAKDSDTWEEKVHWEGVWEKI